MASGNDKTHYHSIGNNDTTSRPTGKLWSICSFYACFFLLHQELCNKLTEWWASENCKLSINAPQIGYRLMGKEIIRRIITSFETDKASYFQCDGIPPWLKILLWSDTTNINKTIQYNPIRNVQMKWIWTLDKHARNTDIKDVSLGDPGWQSFSSVTLLSF